MAEKFRHNNHNRNAQKRKENTAPKKSYNQVQSSLYDDFSQSLGIEFMLMNVLQLAWPVHKVKLDVTVTAEPEDVLKEIHITLLQLIKLKINTYQSIAAFLGLEPTDFLLDELIELRKNFLIEYYDDAFHLKPKGEDYITGKISIQVTEKKTYPICIDGITHTVAADYDIARADDTFQKLEAVHKNIAYSFIESNWSDINTRYKSDNKGQEIVDLSNGRQSVDSQLFFEPRYLLIFRGKAGTEEGKIRFKLVDRNRKEHASACKELEKYIFKSPETYLQSFAGFEYSGPEKPIDPLKEKLNTVNGFMHINFQEVDDYLRYALRTGKTVYMEVPRILRKARQFKYEIEAFLKKPDTKLYLIYGVSDDYQHDAETITLFRNLRTTYSNFQFVDLPEVASFLGLKVSGVHKRVILKDNDFYIETTYNFFTLDASRKEKISAETATIFNRDVDDYFNTQKKTYHLK